MELSVNEIVPLAVVADVNIPETLWATAPGAEVVLTSEIVVPLIARGVEYVTVTSKFALQPAPEICPPKLREVNAFDATLKEIDLFCDVVPLHAPSYWAKPVPADKTKAMKAQIERMALLWKKFLPLFTRLSPPLKGGLNVLAPICLISGITRHYARLVRNARA